MNRLVIDTANNEEVIVILEIQGKKHILKEKVGRQKAQAVLPLLDALLHKNNLLLKDITEINVNPGPGSYTGLRVGIAIANTLGFLLRIPLNGMPVGNDVTPVYS